MATNAGRPQEQDGVVLTTREVERVRSNVSEFGWYRDALDRFRERVEELIRRAPPIPLSKGRAFYEACPDDHAQLVFDPYRPTNHVCPRCGRDWHGEEFDLSWVRQYQDWLGKRLVESGILYRLDGDERYAKLVRDALAHFVRHYRDYPLTNNLLGPTRLFQSTYLEAFWLVDIVAAYDLTRASPAYDAADHGGVRDLLYESSELVRSFDEGVSNRQAFNNAGVGAVALLYEDAALLGHVLQGRHGFAFHMRESLLEDGIWYEGETYHFATLDHSLNLAEMARHRGIDLYDGASGFGSLRPMFEGPLKVMLPDLTFPSRKDSWFGRGIGYHRNVYEMGYARYGEERYGGLLARAYRGEADRRDITWRTFLYLEPQLPDVPVDRLRPKKSYSMPGTGLGVLRRDEGATYVGLEYGHYGGGHGHPDRLNLTLHADDVHWLADPGTGWYHLKELGWYRSSLAHNTVMLGGANQTPAEGELSAIGTAVGLSVAQADVTGAYPGTRMRRTLGLSKGVLIDVVHVESDGSQPVDLTLNVRGRLELDVVTEETDGPLSERGGHPFLQDVSGARCGPDGWRGKVEFEGRTLRLAQRGSERLFAGTGPGIPLREETPMNALVARATGERNAFTTAFAWGAQVEDESSAATAGPLLADGGVRVGDRRLRLHVDDGPGAVLVEEHADGSSKVAWFGRDRAGFGSLKVECLGPLERAGLWLRDGVLTVDLPKDFGSIRVVGEGLPRQVEGLPSGASWHVEGDQLVLEQAGAVAMWRTPVGPVHLSAGLGNVIELEVARFGSSPPDEAPTLSGPAGWQVGAGEVTGRLGRVETWRFNVRPPESEQATTSLEAVCGDAKLELEAVVRPPVSFGLALESSSGTPELVLEVRDESRSPGPLWAELSAPWAERAPRLRAVEIEAGGREEVRMPLSTSALAPTAQEGLKRLGTETLLTTSNFEEGGDNTGSLGGDNAGRYFVDALVRRSEPQEAGYLGAARFRFPLAWARRRDPAKPIPHVGGLSLDRPEQAYWAEDPWPGPEGASARAVLEWDEERLYLRARVRDDRHVADANVEDLYENDSVQLYLDFRPSGTRDATFSPGVAAYIFAPDSGMEEVRVEPIAGSRELANRALAAPWFTSEGVEARCAAAEGGYELDVSMPYASLGTKPLAVGDVFRADLSLSDNDGSWYRTHQLVWSGARGYRRCYLRWAYQDPTGYGWVIVSGD